MDHKLFAWVTWNADSAFLKIALILGVRKICDIKLEDLFFIFIIAGKNEEKSWESTLKIKLLHYR